MSTLQDTFYLNRAGRYSNAQNSNDALPLVYGDLTDGAAGIWRLPCIDTVNFVYCFSAFPVLSVAGGNSISIYADGVLVNPANYTFDESNDYESEGAIATVTFTSDQANAAITARGKGKVVSGTTLMDNIVDIVEDLLTVQNAFSATLFEATRKAKAAQVFAAAGYLAAGVVHEDAPLWDTIEQMMGSFLGSAYLDGEGLLCLDIDVGTVDISPTAAILRHAETEWSEAIQRLENVINRCPASYGYDYAADNEFMHHSSGTASENAASQAIYGVREPVNPLQCHWCRDAASVAALQAIVVGKFAYPIYEIVIKDLTLKRLHVDINDFVVCSARRLYDDLGREMRNQIWRVLEIRPDFAKATIGFRLQQTPYFLEANVTEPDVEWEEGTYWGDEVSWSETITGTTRDMSLY